MQTVDVCRELDVAAATRAHLTRRLRATADRFAGHPVEALFMGMDYDEIVLPTRLLDLGLGVVAQLRETA